MPLLIILTFWVVLNTVLTIIRFCVEKFFLHKTFSNKDNFATRMKVIGKSVIHIIVFYFLVIFFSWLYDQTIETPEKILYKIIFWLSVFFLVPYGMEKIPFLFQIMKPWINPEHLKPTPDRKRFSEKGEVVRFRTKKQKPKSQT